MGCLEPLQLLPDVQVIQVTDGPPLEARGVTKTGADHMGRVILLTCLNISIIM